MGGLMIGRRVRVWRRSQSGEDDMGEPVWSWSHEDVDGVAVRPATAADLANGGIRPDGTQVAFYLAFPAAYSASLRRCRVSLTSAPWSMDGDDPDSALVVVGDPQPTAPCPTPWNRIVEVARADG